MDTFKNVKDSSFGAVGNGIADDKAAINSAIASTTLGNVVFFPSGIYRIGSSLTIAKGQKLLFDTGARIQVDPGATLTINGIIEGDLGQKFTGSGTVVFGASTLNLEVPVTWFGVDNDNSASDQAAGIVKAINALPTGVGQILRFPAGQYTILSQISIPIGVGRLKMIGEGFSKTVFVFTPPNSGTNICISVPSTYDRFEMEGIQLSAVAVAGKRTIGIQLETANVDITEVYLTDVNINNFNKYGINSVARGIYLHIDRCRFDLIQNSTAQGGDNADYAYAIHGAIVACATITRSRFATCDGAIQGGMYLLGVRDGTAIEQCGTASRTTQGHIIDVTNGFITMDGVWAEINYVTGTAFFARFTGTDTVRILNCAFGCESGGTTITNNLVKFDTNCFGNEFSGNRINGATGVTWVSVGATCTPVVMIANSFLANNGTRLTNLSDIQPHITAERCDLSQLDGDDINSLTTFSYYGAGDGAIHQKLRVQARASSNPSAGYGASIGFWGSRINGASPTAPSEMANVTGRWDNATAGVEQGALRFNASVAGTMTDLAGVNSNGIIDSNGHIVKSKIVTTNTTLVKADGDCYLNASGLTVTIPDASTEPDRKRTFKLIAAGTGTLASNTIDGATSYTLSAQNKYVTLHSVGSVWRIIAAG